MCSEEHVIFPWLPHRLVEEEARVSECVVGEFPMHDRLRIPSLLCRQVQAIARQNLGKDRVVVGLVNIFHGLLPDITRHFLRMQSVFLPFAQNLRVEIEREAT